MTWENRCHMSNFTTVPKATFINNMVITEETNVILLSQWYPKYMKKIINISNPDYQPIPKPYPDPNPSLQQLKYE